MTVYKVLGVSPKATDEEIRKAYHAIAKRAHPDTGIVATTSDFPAVLADHLDWECAQHAYDLIKTPEKRAQYDAKLFLMAKTCKPCRGSGIAQVRTGWDVKDVECTACEGTGKVSEESDGYRSVCEL